VTLSAHGDTFYDVLATGGVSRGRFLIRSLRAFLRLLFLSLRYRWLEQGKRNGERNDQGENNRMSDATMRSGRKSGEHEASPQISLFK
jgi:hypothetical protein